ncbi:MAG: Gfo/Idh/MocA family protein [Kiritimatiellia bacterium]
MPRIGILGCGNIASIMAKTIQQMHSFELYAVASRSLDRAKAFAAKWNASIACGSYEELAANPNVDLVYVATPHSEHFANMMLCLDHRKNILCEKPFTVNRQQAESIFRRATANGLFVAEAMWTRFLPFVQTIREVLASGIIGTPVLLTANLGGNMEAIPRIAEPALAGGALLDVGIYALVFAELFFGNDFEQIESACTKTAKGVDRNDCISLSYPDGRMALLYASIAGAVDGSGCIVCSNGRALIECIPNFCKMKLYDRQGREIASYSPPPQMTGYEYELLSVQNALQNGRIECPENPHAETLRRMGLMDDLRRRWNLRYPFE